MPSSFAYAVLAVAASSLAAASVADAGNFQVSPTRLDLVKAGAATELAIHNRGALAVRFEAKVFVWKQDVHGAMQLEPTTDLVVYPTLFTLAPGASRAVRVATSATPAATERTYRLFVEELPALHAVAAATAQATIAVRTRIGVPVFVAPKATVIRGAVAGIVRDGALEVSVRNAGTVHVKIATVRAVGYAGDGRIVFDHTDPSWYLLAGDTRVHAFALAPDVRAQLVRVAATATTDRGTWQTPGAP